MLLVVKTRTLGIEDVDEEGERKEEEGWSFGGSDRSGVTVAQLISFLILLLSKTSSKSWCRVYSWNCGISISPEGL